MKKENKDVEKKFSIFGKGDKLYEEHNAEDLYMRQETPLDQKVVIDFFKKHDRRIVFWQEDEEGIVLKLVWVKS